MSKSMKPSRRIATSAPRNSCPDPAVACGCCEGTEAITPESTANRPGLAALAYRVGTHASFLETMKARLSSHCFGDEQECAKGGGRRPLARLTTRDGSDPSIALLDAWATVGDVLTFYQERIANEGYLRTATERRSVLELARLVGYAPRPGVAASTYLAYTIDANVKEEVVIPAGARVQSVPGPDELPQSFETGEELKARAAWNLLVPRKTQPQQWSTVSAAGKLYLKGIATNLKANDPLLIRIGGGDPRLFRIVAVKADAAADRTEIAIEPWAGLHKLGGLESVPELAGDVAGKVTETFGQRLNSLIRKPSQPLANALQLPRALETSFRPTSDAGLKTLGLASPELRESLRAAIGNYSRASPAPTLEVYALRLKAGVFGRNAPKRVKTVKAGQETRTEVIGEWPIVSVEARASTNEIVVEKTESPEIVFLDNNHEGILPGSWVVLDATAVPEFESWQALVVPAGFPDHKYLVLRANSVSGKLTRAEYGMSGETVRVELDGEWIRFTATTPDNFLKNADGQERIDRDFQVIRGTAVYAQSEKLELAEAPIEAHVCDGASESAPLELDGLYQDLEPGRFVIVGGERGDIAATTGVLATEAAMITEVVHDVRAADAAVPLGGSKEASALPGDRIHTFIRLDKPLSYCYRRESLTVYGNVVKATHGETRNETLGAGDGAKALQAFTLKQPPLTWLVAPTAVGAESTLQVFVNDVRWHERSSFIDAEAADHVFISRTDDDSKTTLTFGNAKDGARLPTGIENVKARYRNGIGKAGNVRAGQLSLLSTRPLGVKEVVNPLRASGGADRETRDQARRNAPLAVMSLDRLVSTPDYADFVCSFAGIAKAAAVELSDGRRTVVHVTIAGSDDIPIDTGSDLYRNLRRALLDLGDPFQPVQLATRDLLLLVIGAGVRIDPDYRWESVVTELRARLLDAFGFERRELAQDVTASEVLSAMQSVRGVVYVDLDAFGAVPSTVADAGAEEGRRPLTPEETAAAIAAIVAHEPASRILAEPARFDGNDIRPAQLAVLVPEVPDTLVLNQIKD